MAAASLPVFIGLKSATNSKYLRYVDDKDDAELHGYLQFTGEEAVSPYTKNELVPAREEGLVHIRSCYNNKYWTRVSGDPNNVELIVATADEPVEDRSEWSCTLFETSLFGGEDPLAIRIRHVGLDQYVSIFTGDADADAGRYESCLIARTAAAEPDMVFTMFDWGGSALVLPKKVVFTGGESDRYINLQWQNNELNFDTTDFRLPTVSNEVFYTRDGKVRIRNDFNGAFWRRNSSTSWISADSINNEEEEDPNTLFSLVKPTEIGNDGNVVALRNLGNGRFARRYTKFGRTSGVHATTDFGTIWSDWKVEEPVAYRSIDDVVFHLKVARIYSQKIVTWGIPPVVVSNPLAVEQVISVVLPYTKQRTSTWKSTVSFKSLPPGVTTPTIKTGIPLIGQGGTVEVHDQFEGPYHWGDDLTESFTTQLSEQITIPPHTTATIQLMATTGMCDVPFSYTQRDKVFNVEQVVTHQMNDGIYTCLNSYNFHTQVTVVPLTTTPS